MGRWWQRRWRAAGGYSVSVSRLAGSLSAGALGVRPGSAFAGSGTRVRNVFADTGPTAVVSPVYVYLLAGVFRLFGRTPASIVAALGLNSLFSALTCIPVFLLARRCFNGRRRSGPDGAGHFRRMGFITARIGLGLRVWSRCSSPCFSCGRWRWRSPGRCGTGWALARLRLGGID